MVSVALNSPKLHTVFDINSFIVFLPFIIPKIIWGRFIGGLLVQPDSLEYQLSTERLALYLRKPEGELNSNIGLNTLFI